MPVNILPQSPLTESTPFWEQTHKKDGFRKLYKPIKPLRSKLGAIKATIKTARPAEAQEHSLPGPRSHAGHHFTRVKLLNESSSAHLRHERNSKMSNTKPGTQELGGLEGEKRMDSLEDHSLNINIDII